MIVRGSTLSSKPCLFAHKPSVRPPCGAVLIGGIEGSSLSSKPHLFAHKLSVGPLCGTVLTGGVRTELIQLSE